MRAESLVCYGVDGVPHLLVTSPDAPYVVSAYLEHGECAGWHFAYSRAQQDRVADVVANDGMLRRAILAVWFDAVDPWMEGRHPAEELDLMLTGSTGWARLPTDEREDRMPVTLLSVDEQLGDPSPVRLGEREVFARSPEVPAEQLRAAGVEYIQTGRRPTSVNWQRRTELVPVGPFGRRVIPEADVPHRLEWTYPKQAQPWAHDPPPLDVNDSQGV